MSYTLPTDGADNGKWGAELNAILQDMSNRLDALETNLSNEISRAEGAENTLTTNLNNEITRAQNAENNNASSISSVNNTLSTYGMGIMLDNGTGYGARPSTFKYMLYKGTHTPTIGTGNAVDGIDDWENTS